MSDDEDDFMSDKFLTAAAAPTAAPKTYRDIRREAQRLSAIKNEANRSKSRRQLEEESRQEGLQRSLFERAKEEEAGVSNKALGMMMKMGFKVGEALGPKAYVKGGSPASDGVPDGKLSNGAGAPSAEGSGSATPAKESTPTPDVVPAHRTVPLPINIWSGRKGLGLGKRARSPSADEAAAKVAKLEEEESKDSYRTRARAEFEERRAEGRLISARKTCISLDEKIHKKFNVYWLNPHHPSDFPPSLIEYLTNDPTSPLLEPSTAADTSWAETLRRQMRRDALRSSPDPDSLPIPFGSGQTGPPRGGPVKTDVVWEVEDVELGDEEMEDAVRYLRLDARGRLTEVLAYLRSQHHYCFWCGTEYASADELASECPGPEEDDHD